MVIVWKTMKWSVVGSDINCKGRQTIPWSVRVAMMSRQPCLYVVFLCEGQVASDVAVKGCDRRLAA